MALLELKPTADEVIQRLRGLYERQAGDRIFATMRVPSATITEFGKRHPDPDCAYPDPAERAEFWGRLFCERVAVEDDSMPAAYLSEFDQGLYGGLLGGEVRFLAHPENGWISSMVPRLMEDWSQFDRLKFDKAHPWWQRYVKQLEVFVRRSQGRWSISHFILIDSLNFVFELVGATETYLGMSDCPDRVRQAIDFAFDVNMEVQRTFFEMVPLLEDGTVSNFAQWIPGRIVSESLDPYHMTSVDGFEQWGREPVERILAEFDGGVIHLHGNGRHLLSAASTIRGLKAMLLADDTGFAPAFEILDELKAHTGDVPVSVFAPYEQFIDRLSRKALPGGVLYQVTGVADVDAANRCMEKVRAYRV